MRRALGKAPQTAGRKPPLIGEAPQQAGEVEFPHTTSKATSQSASLTALVLAYK